MLLSEADVSSSSNSVPIQSIPKTVHMSVASSLLEFENYQPVFSDQQLQVILPYEASSSLTPSTNLEPVNTHSMQTRSKSGIVKPKKFQDYQGYFTCLTAIDELDEPCSYKLASYSAEWSKAMQEEIDALQLQGTWSLVPNPGNENIVVIKWIYKIKKNSYGSVARYKARLVAWGFS